MRQTWKELRTMTTTEQGRARQMADRNLAEIEIGELRAALEITQADLAGKLKVTGSRIATRGTLGLAFEYTPRQYVEALGGKVEVRAVSPRKSVRLTHATAATAAKTARRR
jgi:hypothetical protein